MDHTIVHFEIPAEDPERAAKFYRELFGWKIDKFEGSADKNMPEYWMVSTVPTDGKGMPHSPGRQRRSDAADGAGPAARQLHQRRNVDEYAKKAERLGAKVVVPKMPVPGMGWFAQLNDPEGNLIAIWQTDDKAGG